MMEAERAYEALYGSYILTRLVIREDFIERKFLFPSNPKVYYSVHKSP
jgi:hypothetical protein